MFELGVVAASAIYSLWDIFENKIEIHFVLLLRA